MTKKLAICLAALMGLAFVPVAHAGDVNKKVQKRFEKFDTNADGALDLAEYLAFRMRKGKGTEKAITKQFEKKSGGDGSMSVEEFAASMGKKKKKQ